MRDVDDLAGVPDGYTAKALHPDTPSGRQARPATVQDLIEAVYGPGARVCILPPVKPRARLSIPLRGQLLLPLEEPQQPAWTIGVKEPIPRAPRGGGERYRRRAA